MIEFDTPNEAVKAVVIALGGSKQIAPQLWPEKSIEEARRLLADCINDDRPAKLDFAQVLFIFKLAKAKGVHAGADYIAGQLGYSKPVPIEPVDEMADLLRQVAEQQKAITLQFARLAVLQPQLRAAA